MDIFIQVGIAAVFGLCFGSFASVLITRLPVQGDVVRARSACPQCHRNLTVAQLVPVFSWLMQGGKCGHCRHPIPVFYPLVEVLTALLFVGIVTLKGAPEGWFLLPILFLLLVMAWIDLRHFILPDGLTAALGAYGLFRVLYVQQVGWLDVVISVAIWLGVALLVRGAGWWLKRREALGWGDVKLLAVCGVLLPPGAINAFLFTAGLLGVVTALLLRCAARKNSAFGVIFPFGPALCATLGLFTVFPALPSLWQMWVQQLVAVFLSAF